MQYIHLLCYFFWALLLTLPLQTKAYTSTEKPFINLNIPQNDPIYQPGGLAYNIISAYFPSEFSDYSFRYVNMSYQRFWIKVNQGDDVCNVFGLLSDNDKNTISSTTPTFMLPSPAIFMHKKVAKKLKYDEHTDAQEILNDNRLFGTYLQGRRLHSTIDQNIARLEKNNQHRIVGKNYALSNIHQLLTNERFDYFIGLPSILINMMKASPDDFTVFEFKALNPSKLYLVCNQSLKNQAFIEAFDNNKKAWFAMEELAIAWQLVFQGQAIDPFESFAIFQKKFNTP